MKGNVTRPYMPTTEGEQQLSYAPLTGTMGACSPQRRQPRGVLAVLIHSQVEEGKHRYEVNRRHIVKIHLSSLASETRILFKGQRSKGCHNLTEETISSKGKMLDKVAALRRKLDVSELAHAFVDVDTASFLI